MLYTVVFKCEDGTEHKTHTEAGKNLLELAQEIDVNIDAPCGGHGTCGKCRGKLIAGSVEFEPNIHLSTEDAEDGWRLLCCSKVAGDATIWIPNTADSFKTGIRTADFSTPAELARYKQEIDAIFATGLKVGRAQSGLGVAIDIGTTTVAAVLVDIASGKILAKDSMGNGQIRYGADVINRIINQGKVGGIQKLQAAVREETLVPMIEDLCEEANVHSEQVEYSVIAGNTTMEHLFLGVDAQSIRLEPYVPAFLEMKDKTAHDVGLPFDQNAPVMFAPNVGSYVGGDITAGVLASGLWHTDKMTLFIDLGTNGEIVFGNADYMLCCACSAGPAFEGGDISCGMRATTGAIDSCVIDKNTMEPTFTLIGESSDDLGEGEAEAGGGEGEAGGGTADAGESTTKLAPVGICGSGIIDIVAELFKCGIISPRGEFVRDGKRVVRDEISNRYVLSFASEGRREVSINETDIDNFIRAKGAIFSAIRAMMASIDMPVETIEQVIIAGGIGSGINIANAITIGMLPKIDEHLYSYIGNSSLTGACAMLVSQDAENKVFDIAHNMTYIELSTHPGYMDEFVAACFLPHTDASLFA